MAIIGAGIAGIAAAYYLCVENNRKSVVLIDSRQPMSYTSAQSGDNYRNWWPHRTMTDFTNDSIDELDRLARESNNVFNMTRGGYCLATRKKDVSKIIAAIPGDIDIGVIDEQRIIQDSFPALSKEIENVIHIRRGGDFSGQQLGQYMLQVLRERGGRRLVGDVLSVEKGSCYQLNVMTIDGPRTINADMFVNAAGPFVGRIARMLGVELSLKNIYQQKIAFEDHLNAVPRDMPFTIDLDSKHLNWSDEERQLIAEDADTAWLTNEMPAGTHCRPDGGVHGKWVKLGWAYNERISEPQTELVNESAIDPSFPEIVIRGAAQLLPSLQPYVEQPPIRFSHYGGYYTMTNENWPLIGPLDNDGAFVIGALSGFGSMAACAAAKLCAAHMCGSELPAYASDLSPARLGNDALMEELAAAPDKGLL